MFKVNGQYGYPFPMTCPGSIPTCSLSVSPNFGYYQSIYENFIALPKSCNEYEFQSYCYPMVNNALSNIIRPSNPVGSYSVMTAYLNQSNSWINSSSNIRNHNPCPLVCINSRTNYSFNALDIDGDSLVYNLINLQDYSGYIFSMGKQFVLPNRNLIYRSPTSAQHPTYDCGFNFNSKTGEYKFKPDTVQESGVSIKIDEYRNGQLVGYTQRVCEFFVLNHNGCGEVSLDTASTTTCTVVKNTMEITDSFGCYLDKYKLTEMVFCENSALDIRLKVINKDKKVVKLNTFTSPGIVVDLDTNKLDSIRNFKIQWTNAKAGKHTAVLELNSCPDTGLYNNRYSNHVLFPFQVLRTPRPSKDTLYYCAKGGAKEIFIKNLDSGVTVSWSHHNGIVQSNLDTTKVKIALTHDTTYYIYYKYFGNANPCATCNKVDTLFVKYVPDFNHTLTPQNATVCINAGANINIQGDSLKKPFNFIWSSYQRVFHPTTNLLLDSASAYLIANPIIKPFLDSKYYVTITDKNGCSVKDSVQIKVIDSIPNFSISASKTAWCGCDTAQLSIQANQIAFCQNSDFPINTATSVANTSSSNFSWPKFPDTSYPSIFGAYGGKYVKHRFFIPNSELKAMNVAGKNLKQFSFYTDTITQIKYKKVRIEISCSEFSKLDAKLYPTTVFYKDSMIILSQMEFIVPLSGFGYNLGKEENLFIDFSFENDTTTKTNSQFIVDSTSYYSASCIYSNFPIGSLDSSKNYFFYRPKFSFYVRSPKTVSPSSLIWSPSAGLSNTTSFNPIVNRCAPITYTCTASSGVCNAMDTITIFADTNNLVSYDTFVCSDIPVRLNTSIIGNPKPGNSFTYLWRSNPYNPSLLDTTILNPIIIPYQTAYYFLKVSGGACDKYDTVKITRGSPLNLSMNKKDPTCSGANGRAVVKTNNGIGPFTYTWNPSNINDDTIKNITSGKYKVTVQAADGCLSNDSITLNNIIQTPSLTLTKQNVRCFNEANGSVKVKVNSAETGPFQYTWIPANANKDSIFNLAAGWYSVTVLDTPSNCTARDSILITQPSKLSIDADSVDVLCFGNNTGSLNTKTTGGTPTYTYTWSDISIGNNASANNKTAGNYTVTVIDSKGCRDSNATRINQPIKLTGSLVNKEDVKCYGDSNGIALIDVIGGTKPYQYNWGNSTNETDSAVNTLKKGNHQVIITDKNNCIDTVKNISIAQPDSIYIQINAYPAKCFGQNNGSAKAIATGGNGGYSYSWSEGSNTDSINSKTAGIYSLTVTDIKGCNEQASTIIYQSDSLMSKNNQADSARCKGEQNGRAIVHILGGKRPYTFAWNTSPIQTDSIAINLSANDYSVTSTDANGCKKIDTIAIAEPIKLQIDSIKIDPIDCESINGGRIEIKASGGNTGVQYSIGPFFQNSAIFTNIDRGVYTATARDYKGCQDTKVFTILQGK
ncbi:MAG: SprB repeat-containing protein, partial [Chitinophagales bacterium]|nr:SprB repeat-containing protein [Chitinophagales bacterium]